MGCVKSSNIVLPVESVVYPKGVLTIELQNAYLFRDTALVSNMDPYVILNIGQQTLKSLVQKNQGANPVFHQKFFFYINSDKINTGRCLELQMIDKNVVTDRNIGFGVVDLDSIIINKMVNYSLKCHINYDMKPAGWVKMIVSFKQDYQGKLIFTAKTAKLARKVGFGEMQCAVRITIGQDESITRISEDSKDSPPVWDQRLVLNLLNSLKKAKLQVVKVSGSNLDIIGETDLQLQKYLTKQQTFHNIELKFKDTYAGNIEFSTMILSSQQYERFRSLEQPSNNKSHSKIQSPNKQPLQSPQKHNSVQASLNNFPQVENEQQN